MQLSNPIAELNSAPDLVSSTEDAAASSGTSVKTVMDRQYSGLLQLQ
jgi:hypothetical protein